MNKEIHLSTADKIRIICAGLAGGTIGSFISLILHYVIVISGLIPGF